MNPMTTATVFLITATFTVWSTSLRRPAKCTGNPDLLMRFCCAMPPFFTIEVAKQCGAGVQELTIPDLDPHNVTQYRRMAFNCRYWYCVLDKYALITPRGKVDQDKFYNHLDLWVTLNPSFTDVMIDAKLHCKRHLRYFFPLPVCQFKKLSMCFRHYLRLYCPVPYPIPSCQEQTYFYRTKGCAQYFL